MHMQRADLAALCVQQDLEGGFFPMYDFAVR
jgi:hypothetical protein